MPDFQIADPVRDLQWAAAANKEVKKIAAGSFPGSREELQLLESCCTDIFQCFAAN